MIPNHDSKESTTHNGTFTIIGVSCFDYSFVVGKSFALRINIYSENLAHQKFTVLKTMYGSTKHQLTGQIFKYQTEIIPTRQSDFDQVEIYLYKDVHEDEKETLMNAGTQVKYFSANIKNL